MKDVNDLMQAILEMDAAQRKASEKAKAERTARLAALDARKQAIAAECDAKAQTDAEAAAKALFLRMNSTKLRGKTVKLSLRI